MVHIWHLSPHREGREVEKEGERRGDAKRGEGRGEDGRAEKGREGMGRV
jgi:hypothetical protein